MQSHVSPSWPRAILHLNADAFCASVAQVIDPTLQGQPVITGLERGMVIAASHEAQAQGVEQGMSIHAAKRQCPTLIAVPSNYAAYDLFSKRIVTILRRFTPDVEECAIDEAYANLSGLGRMHQDGYAGIAQEIQSTILRELNICVSVGVSISKTLAKLCSKWRKPHGCVVVPSERVESLLAAFGMRQTGLPLEHLTQCDLFTASQRSRRQARIQEHWESTIALLKSSNNRRTYGACNGFKSQLGSIL